MPERLHPGVYVEEVSGGVKPIEGVSTSTAAFLGEAARGVPGRAQLVTGFAEFERAFGGFTTGDTGLLAHAVSGFFESGGRRAYVVRVLPSDATRAQTDQVPSRLAGGQPALQFLAKGAGVWANSLRVAIGESSNFPADAFKVEVQASEDGATRRLEVFDDVRMEPDHEDYVVERMKTSRYVEAVDLFAAALAAPTPPALAAAASPKLTASPPAGAKYVIPDGKRLTVTAWDAGLPDAPKLTGTVDVTKAALDAAIAGNTITAKNGVFELAPTELAALLNKQLGADFAAPADASPPSIGVVVGTPPVVTLSPAGGATYNVTGQVLRVTINGGAPVNVPVTAGNAAQATAAELAKALSDAGLGLSAAVAGNTVVVTGVASAVSAPTLAIASSPTAAAVNVQATTAGTKGPGADRFDHLRLTIGERITATAPPVLRELGFGAQSRGYAANSPANPSVRPALTTAANPAARLAGGGDGKAALKASDFKGSARDRTGLHALDGIDVNLVALPGKNDIEYITEGITYCDRRGDCFFLADGPGGTDRSIEVKPDDARAFVDSLPLRSKNSAMFYPWIRVSDPVGLGRNPTRFVAPSGHVAGIFARTDTTRGVWKAPAGIEATVAAALGLQYQVLDAEQDLLNPASLNCLRQFPGVGIVSWGTRTLSADPEWRYVPVRRMGLFLKESLRRGLQWVVFEPNDTELWGRIKINIDAFMMTLFRQGAFQGTTPEEAFAVACDRTTNPQENVDAGIVTAKVAFAPLKPAEFVVIEISQKSLLVA